MKLSPRKRKLLWIAVWTCASGLIGGCRGDASPESGVGSPGGIKSHTAASGTASPLAQADEVPDEQPGRVYYEVFVRSFRDSDGDGIGDLRGLTDQLDYLNDGDPATDSDLGVEGIWLMPVQPSPSYHGYDVTDYYGIEPDYGTMEDFRTFLSEAHKRGIRVIMDLVVNHTSSEHPWFKDAASGPASTKRLWYTWASEGTNLSEGSATGSPAWHPVKEGGNGHYLGTFWEGMPDLNFDNPEVRRELASVGQFWLKEGVDGFRLDAAKHIYENLSSDRGKKETAEKNLSWWKDFRSALDAVNPKAYLVGEVWENSAALVAPYLSVFDSSFNFGTAAEILKAVQLEKGGSIASNLERIYRLYANASGSRFTDAVFLTNHDQDRVMSVLNGRVDQAKMAAAMLLTLPGNPFLYYGEELGMSGRKPDEYIREPMPWNGGGRTGAGSPSWLGSKYNRTNPVSVAEQEKDPQSLLNHYKKLIRLRNGNSALRDGGLAGTTYEAPGLVAYKRATGSEQVLVMHNVSASALRIPLTAEDAISFRRLLFGDGGLSDGTVTLPAYSSAILK
ncbi:alpha-amylase family glycosyl hydrolase [Gorillibacterium sp. sgz5001074]|uniref:alpha-amylase family glycosyl hydrolase n=1 Tax=Gorillibacterium sp. sgz5001074 TaxID=3446695 RepID=UPI003F660F26